MRTFVTILPVALIATLAGCNRATTTQAIEQPIPARVISVHSATSPQTVLLSGVVKPRLEADLSSQILAPVTLITKREGDRFRKGELLVRLHAPALAAGVAQGTAGLEAAVHQANAAAVQAKLAADTLARYQQLRERHSVTPNELEQVRAQNASATAQQQNAAAQVAAARAAQGVQRANATDTTLFAPFDGVVARRMVDPGAMASPGTPLLHLQSTGTSDIEFSVPENIFASLSIGSEIPVSLSNGGSVSAKVAEVAPAGDASSHSFLVKARLPISAQWSAGTIVQVHVPVKGQSEGVIIPREALLQQGGLDAVLVISPDGRAVIRYVTIESSEDDSVRVLTGLAAGTQIVAHADLAFAGKKIEVRQ